MGIFQHLDGLGGPTVLSSAVANGIARALIIHQPKLEPILRECTNISIRMFIHCFRSEAH